MLSGEASSGSGRVGFHCMTVAEDPLFPSALTAATLLLLAALGWRALRRRHARGALALALVGAALAAGAFVPWWSVDETFAVEGRLGGDARLPVVPASPDARVVVDGGGSGAFVRGQLSLSCPARCNFTATHARAEAPFQATMTTGPVTFVAVEASCAQVPFTMRALTSPACSTCRTEFVFAAGRAGVVETAPGPRECVRAEP